MNNDNFLSHVTLTFDNVYKQFKLSNDYNVMNTTMPCRSSVQAIAEACVKMELAVRSELHENKRVDKILANLFRISETQLLISQNLDSEVMDADYIDYDSLCNFAERMPDKQVSGKRVPRKV